MDHSSFGNLGAAGAGSSSGGSNSAAKPSSSFLQLPLSSAASPTAAGVAYYGAPLALLHHSAAGPSSSSHPPPYGKHEISPAEVDAIKAKIVAHPQYSALLAAYLDCQKVRVFEPSALLPHTSQHHHQSKSQLFFLFLPCVELEQAKDLLNLMRNPCIVATYMYSYIYVYMTTNEI